MCARSGASSSVLTTDAGVDKWRMRVGGLAMTDEPFAQQAIPLLKSNEEQLAKIRRQLEGMFRELRLVQDVILVCSGACESVSSDLDGEVEHVLRRCGSNRLQSVLKTLTEIVARFGGTTEMSAERQKETP
jgi:hypothetical protein